jgi:hypothetical protein
MQTVMKMLRIAMGRTDFTEVERGRQPRMRPWMLLRDFSELLLSGIMSC